MRRQGFFGLLRGLQRFLDGREAEEGANYALIERAPAALADVSVGRFNLIGLHEVRKALGPRWPKLEKNIRALTEAVIRANLDDADVFERSGDAGYIVLFARYNSEQADERCRYISNEIARHLVAASGEMLGGLELLRAEVPAAALRLPDPEHYLQAALAAGRRVELDLRNSLYDGGTSSRDGGPGESPISIWPGNGSPSDLIVVSHRPAGRATALTGRGAEDEPSESSQVIAIRGRLIGPEEIILQGGRGDAERVRWSYTPVWDFARSTLIRYRLTAVMNGSTVHPHSGDYRDVAHVTVFQNDVVAMRHAVSQLQHLGALGRRFLLVCPIHHTSTALDSRRSVLLHELKSLSPELRKLLTIEVVQPDQPATWRELDDFVHLLRMEHVSVSAFVRLNDSAMRAHISPGVSLITTDVSPLKETESIIIQRLDALADRTLRSERECGVYGLPSRSLVVASSASGFRYLAGAAVHANVAAIDRALRFTHLDLYRTA